MDPQQTLAMVLAGGEGKRLAPLTADRAKPAVPFAGGYRLIDFALSNLVNAGFARIVVLTQYKSHSLDRHIAQAWRLSAVLGHYVATVPAQMRRGPHWFLGSADAIFQNLNLIADEAPEHVLVFGADHIYRMDPRAMLAEHAASGAGVTLAGIRVPRAEASQYGVIETAADGETIAAFQEKPAQAAGLPDAPDEVYASMGNYIFATDALVEAVAADAADPNSRHDVGGNLVPRLVTNARARVHDFGAEAVPGATERDRGYWRDVGTLDAYYDAHMDLVSVHPVFNLYNQRWPIHTWSPAAPPAKFVFDDEERRGVAIDSLVSAGVIVAGAQVRRSVLSPGVVVEAGAQVEDSVVLHDTVIGAGAVVRGAILDKQVRVEPGARIGVDPAADAARATRSAQGIVVFGKGAHIAADPAPAT